MDVIVFVGKRSKKGRCLSTGQKWRSTLPGSNQQPPETEKAADELLIVTLERSRSIRVMALKKAA
ncbi:hypothetical protein [Fibrisoma montanum]|uniref:hypothetical protein n=1 Tax=Fibrisoma montanum TaxID=2305895 RepID=UPI0011C21BDD|nr:hypothetical protein [Fibrisoma montanum]